MFGLRIFPAHWRLHHERLWRRARRARRTDVRALHARSACAPLSDCVPDVRTRAARRWWKAVGAIARTDADAVRDHSPPTPSTRSFQAREMRECEELRIFERVRQLLRNVSVRADCT